MLRRLGAALLFSLALAPSAQAACPDDAAIARFAGQILQRQSPTPFAALSPADGRCVQEKLVAIFAQPLGDVVGFKLGLTNPAIQQRFGIDHPIRGAIFTPPCARRRGRRLKRVSPPCQCWKPIC